MERRSAALVGGALAKREPRAPNGTLCDQNELGNAAVTGVNVGLLLAGGASLVGAGFVVRRLARNPS
jgi:hypothetical protein